MKNNIVSNRRLKMQGLKKRLSLGSAQKIELPSVAKHELDYPLLIAIICICAFGIVMLFSASYYYAEQYLGDGLHYVRNQLGYLIVGIGIMIGISHIPYTTYSKPLVYWGLYFFLLVILGAVLVVGSTLQGATRWLNLGFISIQPSEFAKFILAILLAALMTKYKQKVKTFGGLILLGLLIAVPAVLIYFQPNLSMLIIVLFNFIILALVGGCDWKQVLGCCIVGGAAMIIYLKTGDNYQSQRFALMNMSWEELQKLSGDEAFQIVQSLYAFANGGPFGQGFDASRQKLLFLPYRESDYILPIIAEELGFVGVLLLMLAYLYIIHRGLKIARNCPERFGSLLAVGMTIGLAVNVLIYAGGVSNFFPATGQTLPFISSGGTSLLAFMMAMGVLLNISRYTEKNKVK